GQDDAGRSPGRASGQSRSSAAWRRNEPCGCSRRLVAALGCAVGRLRQPIGLKARAPPTTATLPGRARKTLLGRGERGLCLEDVPMDKMLRQLPDLIREALSVIQVDTDCAVLTH